MKIHSRPSNAVFLESELVLQAARIDRPFVSHLRFVAVAMKPWSSWKIVHMCVGGQAFHCLWTILSQWGVQSQRVPYKNSACTARMRLLSLEVATHSKQVNQNSIRDGTANPHTQEDARDAAGHNCDRCCSPFHACYCTTRRHVRFLVARLTLDNRVKDEPGAPKAGAPGPGLAVDASSTKKKIYARPDQGELLSLRLYITACSFSRPRVLSERQ